MLLYLDASAIIYAVESRNAARTFVRNAMRSARDLGGGSIASLLARLECHVKPLRDRDMPALEAYERFWMMESVRLVGITEPIERATDLRVRYRLKTPDAIHLATALEHRADRFLTDDATFTRCGEIPVDIIAPTEP